MAGYTEDSHVSVDQVVVVFTEGVLDVGHGCDAIDVVNFIYTLSSLLQGAILLGAPLLLRNSHLPAAVYTGDSEPSPSSLGVCPPVPYGLDEAFA